MLFFSVGAFYDGLDSSNGPTFLRELVYFNENLCSCLTISLVVNARLELSYRLFGLFLLLFT